MKDIILIVDFGSQYTQLIAKQVRKQKIFSEIIPYTSIKNVHNHERFFFKQIKGVILSGGPQSVMDKKYDLFDLNIFTHIPILGICFGAQLIAKKYGEKIETNKYREFGSQNIFAELGRSLFDITNPQINVWMSHNDTITTENNIDVLYKTSNKVIAAFQVRNQDIYGVQFHPEVSHTQHGNLMLTNFIKKCDITNYFTMVNIENDIIQDIKNKVKNDTVLMAVSGGVDSTVAATLLHKALGRQLQCIFVDNGLLRKNEAEEVMNLFKSLGLSVHKIDASKEFYMNLLEQTDPEQKRKIIGATFIHVFTEYIKTLKTPVKWMGQGTIYPDVIESVPGYGKIKSHHNVGGLPSDMEFSLVEPLRMLFKDEVRELGEQMKIHSAFIYRHPFPGPGLAIRIIGKITKKKISMLQDADHIFITALKDNELYDKIWQAGAILLPVQSVGVMGDKRTYEYTIALRAVCSVNGMTAKPYGFNMDLLEEISTKIVNNVPGINRIVYDTTSKPPGTIEWE
jgi:GMP synthase (glutamine-hydrolysing)